MPKLSCSGQIREPVSFWNYWQFEWSADPMHLVTNCSVNWVGSQLYVILLAACTLHCTALNTECAEKCSSERIESLVLYSGGLLKKVFNFVKVYERNIYILAWISVLKLRWWQEMRLNLPHSQPENSKPNLNIHL